MSIHDEFLTNQDILDYVALNYESITTPTGEEQTRAAVRVLDSVTLLKAAEIGGAVLNKDRPVQFAVMICAEAIEAYEISVGLREKAGGDS